MGDKQLESIWSFSYVALLIVNFLGGMGQMVGSTIIPLYARDLGIAATTVGFIAGAFAITALLARPFAGPAIDSFPKKPLFLFSAGIMAISFPLYPLATTPEAMLAIRLLSGLGNGCMGPLGLAIVSELVPMSRLSSGISIYALSFSVAQAIGPAFGIWCKDVFGYTATFVSSGAFVAFSCVLIAFMKLPNRPDRPPFQLRLDRIFAKQAFIPTAIVFLLAIAFSCTGAFMAIYGELRGVAEIGMYFTVYAVCLTATRPLFGRLADEHGTTVVIVPAICCFAASYIIVSFADGLPGFLIAAVVAACGYGVASPLAQAIMVKVVPETLRGAGGNTIYTGIDAANLVGPTLGGFAVETLLPIAGSEAAAYSQMWLIMLIPIAAALVLYITQRTHLRELQTAVKTSDIKEHSNAK